MTDEPVEHRVGDGRSGRSPRAPRHRPPGAGGEPGRRVGCDRLCAARHDRGAGSANPPHLFRLLIGLNVVNDAVVIPIVLAISVLVRRVLPRWCILSAQVGLFASAVVVLYAYPLLGDWGRTATGRLVAPAPTTHTASCGSWRRSGSSARLPWRPGGGDVAPRAPEHDAGQLGLPRTDEGVRRAVPFGLPGGSSSCRRRCTDRGLPLRGAAPHRLPL